MVSGDGTCHGDAHDTRAYPVDSRSLAESLIFGAPRHPPEHGDGARPSRKPVEANTIICLSLTRRNGTNPAPWQYDQWKESPQAQEPAAFGLSIVKPCFSIVSTKSIVAPPRYGLLIRSTATLTPEKSSTVSPSS